MSKKFITSPALSAKRKIPFFKSHNPKENFFKSFLHRSIIFVLRKMSALLLFGNFDEKRVDNVHLSQVWFGT